jgi:hypothetical protein
MANVTLLSSKKKIIRIGVCAEMVALVLLANKTPLKKYANV